MAGSEAQAGFYYQNVVAALHALKLIEIGSPYQSIAFENPKRAKYVDDIIVERAHRTTFIQVKWSEGDDSPFTLHNLTSQSDDADDMPLLRKLGQGYRKTAGEPGTKEIVLFSTRKAGRTRQPARGFDKSLREFMAEFHEPFVNNQAVLDVRQSVGYPEYRQILDRLMLASGMNAVEEFSRFLKCLRFELGQPDRGTMVARVHAELASLGIGQSEYGTLVDQIIQWSIERRSISAQDVLKALGLLDHYVDRMSQDFPVDERLWIPTPGLFHLLDTSIQALDSGFILLEGEPGIGKSSALSMYRRQRPQVAFGYFCYIPNERALGNERLERDGFIRSLCIGLRNAFPGLDLPRPYADYTVGTLNDWLHGLSRLGRKAIFVVDGLDHVEAARRRSVLKDPLTSVLEGKLPSNVLVLLSSRHIEALPEAARQHIRSDPRRHIRAPRFRPHQVEEFFSRRGIHLAPETLQLATEISGGVPIYLEYLAGQLAEKNAFEQEQFLKDVPSLRDEKIDLYHSHLWSSLSGDDKVVYILAILAVRQDFTSVQDLLELLPAVGVEATRLSVEKALESVRHVLRRSDAQAFAIRHNSFREFVIEQTSTLIHDLNEALSAWYAAHPDRDEAWRHQFRHLFELGKYRELLNACDDKWFERSWRDHRPLTEINGNIDLAWRAATIEQDLVQFVRVALLKQRAALIGENLGHSDPQLGSLFLDMGLSREALRTVWDGERAQCGPVAFAQYCLHHRERLGRMPPDHVLQAGLRERPSGVSKADLITYYRACASIVEPLWLIEGIRDLTWEQRREFEKDVVKPVGDATAHDINLTIQLAIVHELGRQAKLAGLRKVYDAVDRIEEPVREYAKASSALLLARSNEHAEAGRQLCQVRFGTIPRTERNALLLDLASLGLWDPSWAGEVIPPKLPHQMLAQGERELAPELLAIFDELRLFFLCDHTGFAWLLASVTGRTEPIRTVTEALGRLAHVWCEHTSSRRNRLEGQVNFLEAAAEALDLDYSSFETMQHYADLARSFYHQEAAQFFGIIWNVAVELLPKSELLELADWWATSRDGNRARKYPTATRDLAVHLHAYLGSEAEAAVRQLLALAEASGRQDEETPVIMSEMVACASAYGLSSFAQDAERLWRDLFDLGCGIHWRKDYQFSEIETPLELLRQQHTAGILDRIAEQLALAHNLEGAARSNTIAVGIEGLIAFAARVSRGLALRMLQHEEPSIHRSRAMQSVVAELLKDRSNDVRWVWALACTMERWEDHTDYNEHTRPAMRAIFQSSLLSQDSNLAETIYRRARHIFHVEKADHSELAEWQRLWIQAGIAPESVRADYKQLGETAAAPPQLNHEPYPREAPTIVLPAKDAKPDPRELEGLLDEFERDAFLRERQRELDRTKDKWRAICTSMIGRDLTGEELQAFDEHFHALRANLNQVPYVSRLEARQKMGAFIEEFVSRLNLCWGGILPFEKFARLFDIEAWLNSFVHGGGTTYSEEREIERRLPEWVQNAEIEALDSWAEFCRRRFDGECRATGLLPIAKRLRSIDPPRAFALLSDASKALDRFFFMHGSLAQSICSEAIALDPRRGRELLLDNFRREHLKFPQMIVYRLDQVLGFIGAFTGTSRDELYEVWAAYNRQLTAGLAPKSADVQWIKERVEGNLTDQCLRYLVWLFNYPVVDVRRLAIAALYELLVERVLSFQSLFGLWDGLGSNQKEHVAVLAFSLALAPTSAALVPWDKLVSLAYRENHHNLRRTVSEAVMAAASDGPSLDPDLVSAAKALARRPAAIVPLRPLIALAGGREDFNCPPYQRWVLQKLARAVPSGNVLSRVRSHLALRHPDLRRAWENEMATHREYNINTNFDLLEISGEFDGAVREAANTVLHDLVQGHEVTDDELNHVEDILRLYDPTDMLVEMTSRPARVSWVDPTLPGNGFRDFDDWDSLKDRLRGRDQNWVTIFEHCEQRVGVGTVASEGPATRVRVVVAAGSLSEHPEASRVRIARLRNRYRFELLKPAPALGSFLTDQAVPVVQVSSNSLRGRDHLDTASLRPDIVAELGLEHRNGGCFDYELNGQPVTRCTEWQEPFDQGRRRHEPRSSGFLLEMRTELLFEWAHRNSYALWVDLVVERATDKYKPESQMEWVKRRELFALR
jgi:hypothetical protein